MAIEHFIATRQADARLVATERPGQATGLAAAAVREGCAVVVAVGGDGTMNEVATALVGTGAVLGLIPCGSGNGLARHLGIPLRVPAALEVLLTGRPRLIDSGLVNGRPFFNACGLGFEAEIAARFSQLTSRGLLGYTRVGCSTFFSHRAETCLIRHDAGATTVTAFTLAVLNSDQYGNDAIVAPGAAVDDGRLDLVAVPPVNFFQALGLLWRLVAKSFERAPGVIRLQSGLFLIERTAPGPFHTDGEPRPPADRLEITVRPRSLKIMVP